jgi:hypothetical protein
LLRPLRGNYREEHVFALRQAVDLYDFYQERITECDKEIERVMGKLNHHKLSPDNPLPKARRRSKNQHEPDFALREALYALTGVDLAQITGFGWVFR